MTDRERLASLNKKLNRRLLSAEKDDLDFMKEYKIVAGIAKDVGTASKKGLFRFKERVATLSDAEVKELLVAAEKAETYTGFIGKKARKRSKEIFERFAKAGLTATPEFINDFIQFEKSSIYKRLLDFYSSSQVFEIIQSSRYSKNKISELFDIYLSKAKIFDEDEFREIALGNLDINEI